MKTTKLFLLGLLFCAMRTNAQIPNSGFENWVVYGNGLKPEGWWSSNDSVSSSGTYFPITRSNDHYPADVGGYSIRISNNTSLLPAWGGLGITWPGNWDGNNAPSFPVTGHPDSLCGYYKFLPQANDSMRIFIALYQNGIEVAQAELIDSATASDWTAFTLIFPAYTTADSARIMFSAFDADAFQIHGNSVLYIDNLSFDKHISSVSETASSATEFQLYPNPAADFFTLRLKNRSAVHSTYLIYNSLGSLVKSEIFDTAQKDIPTGDLSNGVYLVVLKTEDVVIHRKLIIQR